MKLLVIYRENSEHTRSVTDFVEMLRRLYPGKTAELVDVNTREGANKAKVYSVMRYPAFLIVATDGRLINQWEGDPLPRVEEVGSLLYA